MATSSEKHELYPYEDLCGREYEHDIVIKRRPTKVFPEYLNDTSWILECKHCGAHRSAGGRLLVNNLHKNCKCRPVRKLLAMSQDDESTQIGLGAIHMMNNDPAKFSEYIKRRDEESRRSNCSRFNYLNSIKNK